MPIFYTKPLIHDFHSFLLVGHWTHPSEATELGDPWTLLNKIGFRIRSFSTERPYVFQLGSGF